MGDDRAELRDYYEAEAAQRRRGPLRGGRLELRNRFIDLLLDEGRRSVLDLGAGPGRDGEAFAAAGFRFVGIDLALGNSRLAAEAGLTAVQGSITAAPVRPGSFEAGWSLSTLMHLDDDDVDRAVVELVGALRPGSPALIGMWGHETETSVRLDDDLAGHRRRFWLRSLANNRRLLEARADVEHEERWDEVADDTDYHVFRLRTPV